MREGLNRSRYWLTVRLRKVRSRTPRAMFAWVGGYVRHLSEHGLHHLAASLGVASLVTLTAVLWSGFEDSVRIYAHLVTDTEATVPTDTARMSSTAPPLQPQLGLRSPIPLSQVAIVKIETARFNDPDRYAGDSPLDRCQLADDLGKLLNMRELRMVAVDLDLSPAERASFSRVEDASQQLAARRLLIRDRAFWATRCQEILDSLLRDSANAGRLVLMAPGAAEKKDTVEWRKQMEAAGVAFGHAELSTTRGIVRTQFRDPPPPSSGATPSCCDPYFGDLIHARLEGRPAFPARGFVPAAAMPIPFSALPKYFRGGEALGLDDDCLLPRLQSCNIAAVILGAGYSADDTFDTPHQRMNGVDVHAANAACPTPSKASEVIHHFQHLAIDLTVGVLLFGPMAAGCWSRYFAWRVQVPSTNRRTDLALAAGHRQAAYLWLLLLLAATLALWAAVNLVSIWLSSSCSVASLSAAFVIGMLIEGATVQGTAQAVERMAHSPAGHDRGGRWIQGLHHWVIHSSTLQVTAACLFWGVYACVVVWSVWTFIH